MAKSATAVRSPRKPIAATARPAARKPSPALARKTAPTAEPAPAAHASVDPISAESLLATAHLGERIKKLRLKRSMGLVELGRKTGLSASFLSQLETGRVVPTLRNLARISLVFEKDLAYFFDSGEQRVFRVQRKRDRVRLPVGGPVPDYIAESFGILIPEGGLRPCMAEFLPNADGHERNAFHPHIYPGVEMVYVLSGCLDIQRRGEAHTLHPRDVLYISGETQRTYRAHGTKPAQALIISFDSEAGELRRTPRRRPLGTTA
jgi:transcriptional regulator with XRE-family HTH domain